MNTKSGVRNRLSLLLVLAGSVWPCCAQLLPVPETPAPTQSPVVRTVQPLLIGPGDLLSIRVFNTAELSSEIRVDESGFGTLPLGARLQFAGLTAAQAGAVVENFFKTNQIMLNPHVSVLVSQFATQGITILGEVVRPGTYTLLGPHSLYDALAAAAGPTASEGDTVVISHHADPEHPIRVDVRSPNYSAVQRLTLVQPGDTIVVARASLIYVVGDVARPGSYPIVNGVPLSVLNILSVAQGLNRTAKATRASVIRETDGKVVTIPLNLNKIMKSEQPNVVLQASDILVVPRSGAKTFLEYALPETTGAVASALTSALIVR